MNPHIHQLHQPLTAPKTRRDPVKPNSSFSQVFKEAKELTISKHAKQRLNDRNIQIDDSKWGKILSKMSEAKAKGVTDSLVVLNDATLVVSTRNNAVVTAMAREEASSHIFTNINGTIVMED